MINHTTNADDSSLSPCIMPSSPATAVPSVSSSTDDDTDATIPADPSISDFAHNRDQSQSTSSILRELTQSLQAWSQIGKLFDAVGQRTIRLGAEEVRSRVTSSTATRAREAVESDTDKTEEDESPPKRRRTSDQHESSVSRELVADAQQIKRMALLVAQMRETHDLFSRELNNFAEKTELRNEADQMKKCAKFTASLPKAE
mmetsp:Transcript_3920/g.8416  ORF Transcript_3920/g.8416 Transcript_3920/m.8416 type:complete len:202 (+) Transcript_3920:146-751(+)